MAILAPKKVDCNICDNTLTIPGAGSKCCPDCGLRYIR